MKPTLLVMAAGLGSRYGGVKQIDAVGMHNETLLDYSVFDAKQSGYEKVVFIIRKDIEADFRERLFDRIANNMDASYVFQSRESLLNQEQIALSVNRKKPWGTVHAILCAKDEIKTPFTVINADDFYGRRSYEILADYLSTLKNDDTDHAMVGYLLDKTMSEMGSVSRGVCNVDGSFLVNMRENTKIEYDSNHKIVSHLPEGDVYLTGNEIVSMNFFGFTPIAFDHFQQYFDRFIVEGVKTEKGECLLPNSASEIVTANKGRIRVFSTPERWFGMTYQEDKAIVQENLKAKTKEGYYPEKLWDKN